MVSEKHGNILHGILLIALFSCAAFYLADTQPARSLSFSPLILGILLGMLYANSLRNHLPETWVPGILFCSKQLLRAGIVLYGFRLTFQSVAAIGAPAIGIDAAVVAGTLLLGVLLGRALKMDRDLALLTSTGSAICGAAAVLGAEPVVKAAPHKTAVAGINSFDTFLLTMAMTALGAETSIEKFKRAGAKPFLLAGLLYLWLLGGGYLLSRWIL